MWRIGEKILGRYTIDDLIAEGGQARLAKVIDNDTGGAAVIRCLLSSPDLPAHAQELARFRRAAALRIGHPNVLDPIAYVEDGGQHYMVLPFVEGCTLEAHVLRSGGKLAVDESVSIIRQVAAGLGACHDHGVTHRDVKPANILIDSRGKIILIDLGLCSLRSEPTLTQGDSFQGTLNWVAPEQVQTPACGDPRLDLYAMGVTFYYLLTGRLAVQGEQPEEIMLSICQWTPPSPRQLDPAIPEYVDQACMTLLRKRPPERFTTAGAFLDALGFKSDATCSSCGCRTSANAKFCPTCGAALGLDARNGLVLCLACGSPVADGPSCHSCHRSFGATDHRLTFSAGSMAGMRFRIPEGVYLVGRNILSPRDGHVSRRQLQIACHNGSIHVGDAHSANRTYINDFPADELIQLQPWSTVRFAGNVATYSQ